MEAEDARGLVLGIILVISGCSQQIPLRDSSREIVSAPNETKTETKTADLITDLTVHSLAGEPTEIRYEKPKLFTLVDPFQSYAHLLVVGVGNKIVRLGLLKELSSSVEWFDPASSDIEQCLLAQPQAFSDLVLSGEQVLEAQAALLSPEMRANCNVSPELMNPLLLVVGNGIFLHNASVPEAKEAHASVELDSTVVSVLGTSLMIHVDDRNHPTFAMIHHYIDEVPVMIGGGQSSKRLRTEFTLKDLKKPTKALFGSDVPKTQELMSDPVQAGCTAVRADWEGEPIYISFKEISNNHTVLLGDLCGVYFGRSKRLYTADAVLGSFIDI